ncbi:hypothetical protein O3P69_008910 [Scylla paramamosain]|uniref:Uncharacterized protein n=1 Tax=Scylla paramamosain TaxID=85552 RepID=A0AAW0TS99_SCYPA
MANGWEGGEGEKEDGLEMTRRKEQMEQNNARVKEKTKQKKWMKLRTRTRRRKISGLPEGTASLPVVESRRVALGGEGGGTRLNQVLLLCLRPAARGSEDAPPVSTEGGDVGEVPWGWDLMGGPDLRGRLLLDAWDMETGRDTATEEHLAEDAPTWHLDYLHPSLSYDLAGNRVLVWLRKRLKFACRFPSFPYFYLFPDHICPPPNLTPHCSLHLFLTSTTSSSSTAIFLLPPSLPGLLNTPTYPEDTILTILTIHTIPLAFHHQPVTAAASTQPPSPVTTSTSLQLEALGSSTMRSPLQALQRPPPPRLLRRPRPGR